MWDRALIRRETRPGTVHAGTECAAESAALCAPVCPVRYGSLLVRTPLGEFRFVCGSGTLRYAFGRQRGIRCDVSVQFGSLFTVHVKSRLCMLAGISIAHSSGRCAPSTSSVSALRSTAVQNGESAGVNESEL